MIIRLVQKNANTQQSRLTVSKEASKVAPLALMQVTLCGSGGLKSSWGGGSFLGEKTKEVQRLVQQKTTLSGIHRGLDFYPQAQGQGQAWGPDFVMGASLLPCLGCST